MKMRQISVFIENTKGTLCDITSVLKDENIDIRAMAIADTTDFGILRIIAKDSEKTLKILKDNNFTATMTDVVAVRISDRPGGLHEVLVILRNADIAIEYAYAFLGREKENAFVILRVDNIDAAVKALENNGISMADTSEVF